jgi:hypothetical protein
MTQVSTIQRAPLAGDEAQYHTFINGALVAIATDFAGASAPTETYAFMNWTDTSTNPATARRRNAANSGWDALTIVFATQAEAEAGTNTAKAMNALRVKQAIDAFDVAAAIAAFSAGDVGTTAFLSDNTARVRTYTAGQNYAGSQLAYSGFYSGAGLGNTMQYAGSSGSGVSGTWQALGSATHPSASVLHHTQFLRIA